MEYVKNLNGTAGKKCSCPGSGSWLEHWERKTNQLATRCAACGGKAEVGGHVKKVGIDYTHYIVPLCNACNMRTDEFAVFEKLADVYCNR